MNRVIKQQYFSFSSWDLTDRWEMKWKTNINVLVRCFVIRDPNMFPICPDFNFPRLLRSSGETNSSKKYWRFCEDWEHFQTRVQLSLKLVHVKVHGFYTHHTTQWHLKPYGLGHCHPGGSRSHEDRNLITTLYQLAATLPSQWTSAA